MRQRRLVGFGRPLIPLQLVEHVAELFARARGGGSRPRRPEVAGGGVEVAAPLVGLAAPEVGEHRVGPQGDGAAVGLDGAEASGRRAGPRRPGRAGPGSRGRGSTA